MNQKPDLSSQKRIHFLKSSFQRIGVEGLKFYLSFSTYDSVLCRRLLSEGVALMKPHQASSPSVFCQDNGPPLPVLLEELIIEILSWLPVISLLRFRCVCKSWKSLISDTNFEKLHLQRSIAKLLLLWVPPYTDEHQYRLGLAPFSVRSLLENPSHTIVEDDCYLLDDDYGYCVVGSCNGLVCMFYIYKHYYRFCLWNPATELALEELACLYVRGVFKFAFGYDSLSDTYKIVAFCLDRTAEEESQKIQVKIYSLGGNCWRNIQSFPAVPIATTHIPWHKLGVYFNGTINWLALCNINSEYYNWDETITIDQLVIVSLELGMETCAKLLLPHCLDEAPHVEPIVGVLMDSLCFSHDYKRTHFVVWQMKEFGVEKSWTRFMKVSYQDLQIDSMRFRFPLLPLCMSENGEVLIVTIIGHWQGILYHPRDSTVKQIELPKGICWSKAMDYVESLISPSLQLSSSVEASRRRALFMVCGGMIARMKR